MRTLLRGSVLLAAITLGSACSDGGENPAKSPEVAKPCKTTVFGGARPTTIGVPTMYRCEKAAPLVVVLHGYTGTGAGTADYLGMKAESEKRGFLYLAPDGTKDGAGNQFWNASAACCDFGQTKVDDSAYISKLIDDVATEWNVDSKRVYLVGHSNGGFMSYQMACEHSGQIAAIASLAGAMRADAATCKSAEPVSVVQIHGTADTTIRFEGGEIFANPYPAATQSVADWQKTNGCKTKATTSANEDDLDLDKSLAGDDTDVALYSKCGGKTEVALWTIKDGVHTPALTPGFAAAVVDFFEAHPKS